MGHPGVTARGQDGSERRRRARRRPRQGRAVGATFSARWAC